MLDLLFKMRIFCHLFVVQRCVDSKYIGFYACNAHDDGAGGLCEDVVLYLPTLREWPPAKAVCVRTDVEVQTDYVPTYTDG